MYEVSKLATMQHMQRVRNLINFAVVEMLKRGEQHDQSKLDSPEVELFDEYTHKLSSLTYGSEEFNSCKKQMQIALDHHYANNTHHPEHYPHGINDMDLLDLLEMFIDWKASSERHHDGNILKSIEINGRRFNMSEQLIRIFENTAKWIDKAE